MEGRKINDREYLEFMEDYKGFTIIGVFINGGWRCGYVVIPKSHLYYGKDYTELDIDCHGGLTFSGNINENITKNYCIGFDCIHYMDSYDDKSNIEYFNRETPLKDHIGFIRSVDFVRGECKSIVEQLIEL